MAAQLYSSHFHSSRIVKTISRFLASLLICVLLVSTAWSAIISDDFSASILDTNLWRLHDPLGDTVVSLAGTGTSDAQLSIAVPGGLSHDPWTIDTAPRLLQTVSDDDFSVEIKFDSPLTQRYQQQGLIIQEDNDTWLRFDFYTNGPSLYILSASRSGGEMTTHIKSRITPGDPPLYLKVERNGQQWTESYSTDGVNWTTAGSFYYVLQVTELGPMAGNYDKQDNAPALTALVDYFFNSDSPIVPEDGNVSPSVWTVGSSVIGNGSVLLDPAGGSYVDGTLVSVTATPDAGWMFNGWSGDLSGSNNPESLLVDSAKAITANFVPEPVPPTISNVQVNVQATSATVTWATDVPASSRVDYGETSSYGSVVEETTLTTAHSLQLNGLTPETTYHYQVTSSNIDGSDQTADLTFTTEPASNLTGITSDDFNSANLNQSLWTLVDPLGDAFVIIDGAGSGDSHLLFSVPKGASHDPWVNNEAARLMQPANNVDFTIETKFDSQVLARYQDQGVIVEQDEDDWLRFDFFSDGTDTHVFAAAQVSGVMGTKINTVIAGDVPLYLRVTRVGDLWRQYYSNDGLNWIEAGNFVHVLAVTAIGPYVGNYDPGVNAPAHTAVIDYFFNVEAPIIPEDVGDIMDSEPPFVQQLRHTVGADSLLVQWYTDELATAVVEYGLTSALGQSVQSELELLTEHSVQVSGLSSDTEYFYRVVSSDNVGNTFVSSIQQIRTTDLSGSPVVNNWYGLEQTFGEIGTPQHWINILGNVSSPTSVESLTYALNGGVERSLTIGPDGRRLENAGDFNVELSTSEVQLGVNNVNIRAQDALGLETVKNVQVNYAEGTIWPKNYSVNWSAAISIEAVAQIVDGKWYIDGAYLRTQEPGYDRLVAIGDITWQDYEVTVPVIVHALKTDYTWPPLVGLLLRWQGHTEDGLQPSNQWYPLGGIGGYSFGNQRLEIWDTSAYAYDSDFNLSLGSTYMMKMRVESIPSGTRYSLKVWSQGQEEPQDWNVVGEEGQGDLASGCLLLLAHEADVSFGTVTITGLQ